MARLLTMFMVLIALQAVLVLYTAGTASPGNSCSIHTLGGSSECGSHSGCSWDAGTSTCTGTESNSLWTFLIQTDKWNSTFFIILMVGMSLTILIPALFIGGATFRFITDFMVFAPAVGFLIAIGVVFMNLAAFIRSEILARILPTWCMTPGGGLCPTGVYILAVFVAPFAFYYMWTVIEWWRGRDI